MCVTQTEQGHIVDASVFYFVSWLFTEPGFVYEKKMHHDFILQSYPCHRSGSTKTAIVRNHYQWTYVTWFHEYDLTVICGYDMYVIKCTQVNDNMSTFVALDSICAIFFTDFCLNVVPQKVLIMECWAWA